MPLPSPPVSLLVRRKLNPNYLVCGSQTAPTSKKLSSGLHFSPEALKTPGTAQGTDVHQEGTDRSVGERPATNRLSRLARVSQKPDAVFPGVGRANSLSQAPNRNRLSWYALTAAGFAQGVGPCLSQAKGV
jgi:hypothetical protein